MKRIILTGGGTAGHVTPNIALIPKLKEEGYDIHYIGSYNGIEKKLIEDMRIPYHGISSGKLRRYFDVKNFFHTNKPVGEIDDLDHFHHAVQLFLDLFESLIVAYSTDGHSGNGRILCGTYGKAVQVIAFAGKKSGNLGQNTYLVFYIEGNPSFFHAFICHGINLLLINNP